MTNPPFFLVGPSRAGTTLLARILGSHSRLAVYVETQFYPLLGADRHRYGDLGRRANLERLLCDVAEIAGEQGQMRPPTPEELFARLPAPTFEGALVAWLRLYAEGEGKVRAADKTPEHYRFLPRIMAHFPDSPVIFVLRDPRDVAISSREAFGTSVASSAWAWREAVNILFDVSRPVHVVRYEDLVARPATVVAAVCTFLGEEWEPEMLRFFEAQRSSYSPHHRRLREPVNDSSIGRFRGLSPRDVACVEAICERMDALGYPRSLAAAAPRRLRPPGRVARAADRVRFYLRDRRRLRRGWLRWRIVSRLRARWLLSMEWVCGGTAEKHRAS